MALKIEWGTSEAHQLVSHQTKHIMHAGIYAAYSSYYRTMGRAASAAALKEVRFTNALQAELPLLGYIATDANAAGLTSAPQELHVARVDPDTGVRLDQTHMRVAALHEIPAPPRMKVDHESLFGFTHRQAELILAVAQELVSHGLEVR